MENLNLTKGLKCLVLSRSKGIVKPAIIEGVEGKRKVKVQYPDGKISSKKIELIHKFDNTVLAETKKLEAAIEDAKTKLKMIPEKLVRLVPDKPKGQTKKSGAKEAGVKAEEAKTQAKTTGATKAA